MREIGPEDADLAIAVQHAAFAEYATRGAPSGAMLETATTVREQLTAGTRVAVIEEEGQGVAGIRIRQDPDGAVWFSRLAVVPAARGRGLARDLVAWARDRARAGGAAALACVVREAEHGNIALYEHLGLRVAAHGSRRSLTGALIAVVEMREDLTGPRRLARHVGATEASRLSGAGFTFPLRDPPPAPRAPESRTGPLPRSRS